MLGRGGIVKHTENLPEVRNTLQNGNALRPPIAPFANSIPQTSVEDDIATPSQGISHFKVAPSDIAADALQIQVNGMHGAFKVESPDALIAKIYFKKKQFVWEFPDTNTIDLDKQRKKRIELRFSDVTSMMVQAREGHSGVMAIYTNKPLALYKEKHNAPGKNTQWDKSEDFTGGFDRPRENGLIKVTTFFARDALTRRNNKASHLEKLLTSDPRIKQLIENNAESSFDQVKDHISEHAEDDELPAQQHSEIFNAFTISDKHISNTEIGVSTDYLSNL